MMFALVVLTLVSFCFVGFTFARYTSSGDVAANATVAKWSITATEAEGNETLEFGMISPEMREYDASKAARENHIEKNIVKIVNDSDVDAKIIVSVTDPNYDIQIPTGLQYKDGETMKDVTVDYVKGLIAKHIKITYKYKVDTADPADYTPGSTPVTLAAGAAHTFVLTATLTWTTDLEAYAGVDGVGAYAAISGAAADAEDTIIGQCVKGFTYTVSYRADQATEFPTDDPAE